MNPFFIFFIALPALEIFLFIKIGGQIGALNTVALIFLTAIIGVYFAKLQGIQTLKSGMVNLYQNKMPIYEIMSGASIAIYSYRCSRHDLINRHFILVQINHSRF